MRIIGNRAIRRYRSALLILSLSGCGLSAGRQHAIINGAAVGAITGGVLGCASAAIADASNPEAYEIGCPTGVGLGAILGAVVADVTYREPLAPPPAPAPVAVAPPPPPAPAERIVLRGVHFDFDKARLRSDALPILDEAVNALKAHPATDVDVNGYTDSVGSAAYNRRLSERRAAAVADYLEQKGIPAERLFTHGFGATDFVASNATAAGRAQNRRVELLPTGRPAGG